MKDIQEALMMLLNKAYSLDNPLLIEMEIDKIFFNALNDIVENDFFSFSKIISYALQLKLFLDGIK